MTAVFKSIIYRKYHQGEPPSGPGKGVLANKVVLIKLRGKNNYQSI